MKKFIVVMFFSVFVFIFTSLPSYAAELRKDRNYQNLIDIVYNTFLDNEESKIIPDGKMIPPKALTFIDESAFEGTAFITVDLLETNTLYIGDNAFANNKNLLSISLPKTVSYISANAFDGSNRLTISAFRDSYAFLWASNNHRAIKIETSFTKQIAVVAYKHSYLSAHELESEPTERTAIHIKMRSTGRSIGELKASRYKGRAALHIRDRYFP